jgi:hypothetical protein
LKPSKCDACNKRLRPAHLELHLTDPRTGQSIGRYHAGPGAHAECMARAEKYFKPGEVVLLNVVHPDRCGAEMEHGDAGFRVVA